MKKRFGELPIGARFCYRAHRYEKMTSAVGRHEENGGSVFHASTEVVALTLNPSPVPNGRGAASTPRVVPLAATAVPKEPRDRLPSEEQRAAALEMLRQLCPPYRPLPDGWHGTYVDEANSKERKNYGTGN
jgi:hypothetical protein